MINDKIIREYFDIKDNMTRHIVVSVNENDSNTILLSLASKLYDNIVNKVDDIDFGSIPDSKGDITKIDNYTELTECLNLIRQILVHYKQPVDTVQTIDSAINNIVARKDLFESGFRYNVELPIIMYSTLTLSVVSSISFLIVSTLEFIKLPNESNFNTIVDKVSLGKSKSKLLFKNLDRFNKSCKNNEFNKALTYIIDLNRKNLLGSGTGVFAAGVALTAIILNIVPILRELIFFFYYTRVRVVDYLEIQSNLLRLNAYNLEHNSVGKKKTNKEIADKQVKIADTLQKISKSLEVKMNKAEISANKELSNNNKKYKTSEITDSLPDSVSSAIF